jgi:hypothetical protein
VAPLERRSANALVCDSSTSSGTTLFTMFHRSKSSRVVLVRGVNDFARPAWSGTLGEGY